MADRTTPADGPCVDGIDHVELVVPGRYEAAAWYADVLGLSVIGELEAWADPPSYPLMGSSDGGRTMLALFHGTPDPTGGVYDRRIAFRTDGSSFVAFVARLDAVPGVEPTGVDDVVSFGRAYSVFFTDPHGSPLEVTTSDHETVARHLPADQ